MTGEDAKRRHTVWQSVGIYFVAPLAVAIITLFVAQGLGSSNAEGGPDEPASEITSGSTVTAPVDDETSSGSADADVLSAEAGAPEQAPVPAPVTLQELRLSFEEASTQVYGAKVGPTTFQLSDKHDRVTVAYTWVAVMSDGTTNESETCQVLTSVTGPETKPAMRTQACTFAGVNPFSSTENVQEYGLPGSYTVTVTDEITGVSGTGSFDVVP